MKNIVGTAAAALMLCSCTDPILDVEQQQEQEPEPILEVQVEDASEAEVVEPVTLASISAVLAASPRRGEDSWVVPRDPRALRLKTMEALLRVTTSEEGWANHIGISAIYAVMTETRRCLSVGNFDVSCRDSRSSRRRAPELSSLWRHSPRATGQYESRTRRQRWTSTMTLDCGEPSGWPPPPYAQWVNYRPLCEALVEEIAEVVDGEAARACPEGSRPITWGCDPFRRRAICEVLGRHCNAEGVAITRGCNDTPIAHRRGLERLDCGETANAYWCRPGTPHCGTLPESERVLHDRIRSGEGERDAEHGLRGGADQVQEPSEGLQRGNIPNDGPLVLGVFRVSGNG